MEKDIKRILRALEVEESKNGTQILIEALKEREEGIQREKDLELARHLGVKVDSLKDMNPFDKGTAEAEMKKVKARQAQEEMADALLKLNRDNNPNVNWLNERLDK